MSRVKINNGVKNKFVDSTVLDVCYVNAIEIWTIRDVNKYFTALNNGINLLIFYNINDFYNWLEELKC